VTTDVLNTPFQPSRQVPANGASRPVDEDPPPATVVTITPDVTALDGLKPPASQNPEAPAGAQPGPGCYSRFPGPMHVLIIREGGEHGFPCRLKAAVPSAHF